jgi:signal transduction histidine kinase
MSTETGSPSTAGALTLEDRSNGEQKASYGSDRRMRIGSARTTTAMLSMGVVVGVLLLAMIPEARLAVVTPQGYAGLEAASTLTRLFASLVLFLFPADSERDSVRWTATGLLVLGGGSGLFGVLPASLGILLPLKLAMYESLIVWITGGSLLFAGLAFRRTPTWTRQRFLAVLCAGVLLSVSAVVLYAGLPALTNAGSARELTSTTLVTAQDLTPIDWAISVVPLLLTLGAVIGAVAWQRAAVIGPWFLAGLLTLAEAQFLNMLRPSAFTSIVTAADALRFQFGLLVAIGAVVALRRIAEQRRERLDDEEERSRRLRDLGILNANFTAMAAHELHSPLASIRGYTAMLGTGALTPAETTVALTGIEREVETLRMLADDVQSAAIIERDDFLVDPQVVPVQSVNIDAAAFLQGLPGSHPLIASGAVTSFVRADGVRIRQVMRNLLSNAAKYSRDGTPVDVCVEHCGRTVKISVTDRGEGIRPEDLSRVFERFGRGRDQLNGSTPGLGLGLYLSRRIVQAHGSDIRVESRLGSGSTFSFELESIL